MEGAKCLGRGELFDSVQMADHKRAREMCLECPVLDACEQRLKAELSADRSTPACPTGTWAGRLLGGRKFGQRAA